MKVLNFICEELVINRSMRLGLNIRLILLIKIVKKILFI